ncbi:DUF4251 domain-containing protein [Maribellus sediminis]|uniref:DUF4251 domain-containing protein n=1 Tax=Maribellus sediminis TaxID=2696285 RepID=UPI0014310566|nr:DUF4251 domain-containing protein [Maribellus sediminis]
MRHILIVSLFLVASVLVQAQETKMSRKEKKAAQKAEMIEKTKTLIEAEAWQFSATQMLPAKGRSRSLTTSYSVILKDKKVDSYLPYFGEAYQADYGSTDSPLQFISDITEYSIEDWKKGGWIIKFRAKNKNDVINFTFTISETGSSSLNVISTNRQSISYYGDLEEIPKKEKK